MYYIVPYFFYFFILFSCKHKSQENHRRYYVPSNDTLFVRWNSATLQSLNNKLNNLNDSIGLRMYRNRIEAFESYIEISDENSVNRKSVRYLFAFAGVPEGITPNAEVGVFHQPHCCRSGREPQAVEL